MLRDEVDPRARQMVASDGMRAKDQSQDVSLVTNQDIVGIDEAEALEGIKRGLADVDGGRVTPIEKFEKDFRKRHGIPRRSR